MSEKNEEARGTFVTATYAGCSLPKGEYKNVYLRTDDKFQALSFSIKVGSDFEKYFDSLEIGSSVVVKTSNPNLAFSKNDKPYIRWFILDIEN